MAEGTLPQETTAAPEQEARSMRWGRIVVWAVVALIIVFLAFGLIQAFQSQPTEGVAPDFTMETYDGGSITLSDLRGQVVVINFWASWCGPCAEEAPDLQQAWEDYRDQGVMFIGVDYVDSEEKGLAYIERFGITYPNGADLGTKISDLYHIRGVPETFVINREGEITYFAMQPLTYQQIASEIEKALAQ